MKFVIETLRLEELKQKLPVIIMEIDYELMTLFEAIQKKDAVQIIKSKEKLRQLRLEKLEIEQ